MINSTAIILRFGLASILIVLGLNAGVSSWNIDRIAEDERWFAHSHEVVGALTDTLSMLKDAETGQRGYLITGDPAYLEPYNAALPAIRDALRRLKALTADNPSQQSRIAVEEVHIDRMLGELAETVRLRRERGFEAAHEVVRQDVGKKEMDAIRASFSAMRGEEVGLLRTQAASSRWGLLSARLTSLVAALLSLGLIGMVYVVMGRGIAERARVEALQDADRRKDEFLAMLAHELRNPLAAIRAALDSIRLSMPDGPECRRSRETIDRQVGHLSRLVDDLLDASRIAQGKLILQREPMDLKAALDLAIEISRPLIDARGHRLSVSPPQEPLYLEGDQTRLAQVFANLLLNAARFSERGSRIELEVVRQGDRAVVRVRDEGRGIAPKMLPHVFGLYTQEFRASECPQDGLGIGLALVRRLSEMHGGTVEAHSEGPNKGSEFIVQLPLTQTSPSLAEESRRLEEPCASHAGRTAFCWPMIARTSPISTP